MKNTTTKPTNQNKMEQTSVNKLIEYFDKQQKEGCTHWCIHDLIAQLYVAEELEKQQIMIAVYDSMGTNLDPNIGRAEQYYNETYKNTKE